ncbi:MULTISPECIES: hypothetical protein [unclassified Nocardia]|uniref:hypothetical protein n=1 Tax=unclassified Nocardia TaxID=2637762 RepID=UPI002E22DA94|nr:hypothetical protein OHA42_13345 [Nocardia sp. NBC_01009]
MDGDRNTITLYANQTVVRSEDLPDVIRAADVLQIGLKIENIMVPAGEGAYSLEWIVTRDDDVPFYEEWDGRYEDSDEEDELTLASVE